MIRLKPITKENYRGCIELKTTKEQEKFVAPNWYSLLEAAYEESRQAFAIYYQEEMIGFLLFSYYEADEDYAKESWWIERFMIDHRFQQKGYGSQSMEAAIEWFRQTIQAKELRISSVKENTIAKQMYEGFGFTATGEFVNDETVLLKEWR